MPLSAGVARTEGGRIKLGLLFHQTAALLLPQSQSVAVPANLQQIYGFLGPGWEWRHTSMSPNFPGVAVANGVNKLDWYIEPTRHPHHQTRPWGHDDRSPAARRPKSRTAT